MKKIKGFVVGLAIGISAALSYGFTDNYFELSKNLDIFSTLFKELNTYYVDDTQPGELMKTAIDEMLMSLDPYTNYIPESDIEDYRFMTTGQYGGIGSLIHQDSLGIVVSEPYEGFPAFAAGLEAGDRILKIDGKEVGSKTTSEISNALKGQAGTSVKLWIEKAITKKQEEVLVNRENIKIDDVPYYAMLNDEVGYIKLSGFTQTASTEFKTAFAELKEKGMKSLVFDLRGNGGGLLIQAVEIVNSVIPKGKLVVQTKGKRKEWDASYKTTKDPIDTEIPIVVLVNSGSASASEIVAGTLQDYDRAVILGKQTFGKGLVQQTLPLSYNAQLKVTVAKYYIPSGRCIQKVDYSNKNQEGVAQIVPDSMIHSFKTLNSQREVFDGKGIKPDVITEPRRLSMLASTLMRNYYFFDFATQYKYDHKEIAGATEFELSEEEYAEFVTYLSDKDYSYKTQSEKILEKLKKSAEKEKYFEGAEDEYLALEAKIASDKKDDLSKFKDEVSEVLSNEIVSRYYYQDGRIAQSLALDTDVLKAIEVLQNEKQYKDILAGNFASK